MSSVLDYPVVELHALTPAPGLICESCEINHAAVLAVLPRTEEDAADGAGRPRFALCSPCAEVAQR